jgi:asparagine synthase (glutamine-hydrolysing)
MCGICGIYEIEAGGPIDPALVKKMSDTLSHRGPDDQGIFVHGPIGLGHRRLSIIDRAGGHQPLSNETGTIWTVFNGEIYNFRELRSGLIEKGHHFSTYSDSEVIVHLYEEYGLGCFEYLRGMFAIALWDMRSQTLVLARDRLGKKPLYYYHDDHQCVFGSELKAILSVPGVKRDLDCQAISDYFSLLYIPAPKSIFQRLRKVRPGYYVVVRQEGISEYQYWDVDFSQVDNSSESEWCTRILNALQESVNLRLISEVPLGAFLSGGVDSSAVVSIMSRLLAEPVVTSSIGFEEKEFNELDYARSVATLFHTKHHEEIITPDAEGIIDTLAWHFDEPFADSSAVPTYYVSQMARRHVTVVLSGDGGDELFAGYRRYLFDQRENQLRNLFPSTFRRLGFGTLAALYPKADWAPRIFRGKATFESLSCSHIEGYFRSISAVRPELKRELLHPDLIDQLMGYETLELFRDYYDRAGPVDSLSRIQYVDIKMYLPDDILAKVDRASMAHSLEVRAPFLDHKLVELGTGLPRNLKIRGMTGKYILKKAFEPVLPTAVLYRPKMGFAVPLAKWFREDLKEMAYESLFGGVPSAVLNLRTLQRLWKEHQGGHRDRSTELWTIFMYRMWEKIFLQQGNGISVSAR